MSYFSLRKRAPEPELDLVEEDPDETEDETSAEEPPTGTTNPLLVGLLGPGNWIAARLGTGTAWGVHGFAAWAAVYYGGWVAVGVVLGWLFAVLLFVPREHLDRATTWIERRDADYAPDEGELEPANEAPADPLVAVMWRLIADAPGVHVKTLAERLQKAAPDETVDRAAVRAKLAARGIPTKPSVRDVRGRVNEGVHRADLKAWEEALPAPSPVPSPEARSEPVATAVTCDVADAPTPVATPLSRLCRALSRGAA